MRSCQISYNVILLLLPPILKNHSRTEQAIKSKKRHKFIKNKRTRKKKKQNKTKQYGPADDIHIMST